MYYEKEQTLFIVFSLVIPKQLISDCLNVLSALKKLIKVLYFKLIIKILLLVILAKIKILR